MCESCHYIAFMPHWPNYIFCTLRIWKSIKWLWMIHTWIHFIIFTDFWICAFTSRCHFISRPTWKRKVSWKNKCLVDRLVPKIKRQSCTKLFDPKYLKTSRSILLLKPFRFERLKIQNNVPDLQHQVQTYSIVTFSIVSIIMEIKTKGMTMKNFANDQKQQFVHFFKKVFMHYLCNKLP